MITESELVPLRDLAPGTVYIDLESLVIDEAIFGTKLADVPTIWCDVSEPCHNDGRPRIAEASYRVYPLTLEDRIAVARQLFEHAITATTREYLNYNVPLPVTVRNTKVMAYMPASVTEDVLAICLLAQEFMT